MKKRALSALMASTMVWSALSVTAFAETDINNTQGGTTNSTNGVQGSMSIVGEVNTKEHREHFRVVVPTDKAYGYKFIADPEKNGEYSEYFTDDKGNSKYTLLFRRPQSGQTWMGTKLPENFEDQEVTGLGGSWSISNKSPYLVVSNIGSQDVSVTAHVEAIAGNDESKIAVGLEAMVRNPQTVKLATANLDKIKEPVKPTKPVPPTPGVTEDYDQAMEDYETAMVEYEAAMVKYNKQLNAYNSAMAVRATYGWLPVTVEEDRDVNLGANIVVGTTNGGNLNLLPGDEQGADYWNEPGNAVGSDWNQLGSILTSGTMDNIVGEDTGSKYVTDMTVRLVRAGGHALPIAGDGANGRIWSVADKDAYFDDALNPNTPLDKATLDSVSSVAFQVAGETWGKGWSDNARASMKVTWKVESENSAAAAINPADKKKTINTSAVVEQTVTGTVGEGSLKALSIEGVYWEYGIDHKEMKLDGTEYCRTSIEGNEFKVTLTKQALENLANNDAGDDGYYLPAYIKVVFNVANGTTEDYFWVVGY